MNDQIKAEIIHIYGEDKDVAHSAWTSSYNHEKTETKTDEDVKRVVTSMAEEGHGVPFEAIDFVIWMRVPVALDRQWMTYRIASHNGLSGRYRTVPNEYLRSPDDITSILDKVDGTDSVFYNRMCENANTWYATTVEKLKVAQTNGTITNPELKRAREFIRGVLPQHNMVERRTKINLRSLANIFVQRLSRHAQPEIRELTTKVYHAIREHENFPKIQHTFDELKRNRFILVKPDTEFLDLL